MECGTSVNKPGFLGLVLLSWRINACCCVFLFVFFVFFSKMMLLQVTFNRTNTVHICSFSSRICIYVPNSSSGILSPVDIIKCLFKEHSIVLP